MIRSTVTPWRANQASARSRKAMALGLALVGQDRGIGQARGVIDGDVQVFPADAVVAVDHAGSAAGDAVPDAGDPAELLGIDVHELAGMLALVAHDRCGRIEALEAAEAEATQDAADRREGQAEAAGDHGRGQPLPTERLDRGDLLGRQPALASGRRAPVIEGRLAARSPPCQPLAHRALTDAEIGGNLGCWLLLFEHATDH
jgi:hypothetical protein